MPNKKGIRISGIYTAPENWKKSFISIDNYLTSTYLRIKPGYIIEAGDFNINIDKNSEEKKNLQMFYDHLIKNNLRDTIKEERKNNDMAYTYNGNNNNKSSRIDYILTSRRLLNSIDSYKLLNGIALNSDHNLTKITINRRLQPKNYSDRVQGSTPNKRN